MFSRFMVDTFLSADVCQGNGTVILTFFYFPFTEICS
jgi:hypothetical protein